MRKDKWEMNSDRRLLNFCIPGCADTNLLPLVKVDVFAALSQHAGRADSCADRRTYCGARASAKDRSDDCANSGGCANPCDVALGRVSPLHAAFRIDFADALAGSVGKYLDDLCTHL